MTFSLTIPPLSKDRFYIGIHPGVKNHEWVLTIAGINK